MTQNLFKPGAKVLVVDDEPDILDILREWLVLKGYVVFEAKNGSEALMVVRNESIDVVVTDLDMPGLDGLQLLSILKEMDPDIPVIFLTGKATVEDVIAALRGGRAFDFLQKPLKDLPALSSSIDQALRAAAGPRLERAKVPAPAHLEALSPRELEIVALLSQGLDNRTIAERLVISEKTVQNHLTRIYEKLKVSNRTQAVLTCQQFGLL